MEFTDVVRRRHMVRHYTGEPVDPEALDRVVDAARRAPSAGGAQGVSVVVVTDPVSIAAVAERCGEARYLERGFPPWLSSAPAHLVLCVEPEVYRARYRQPGKDPGVLDAIPWWWVDGGATLMAVLLAAVAEGLAAGFLGGHSTQGVAELLGVPAEVEVLGVVTVGHPAPEGRAVSPGRRRRTVHRQRWLA